MSFTSSEMEMEELTPLQQKLILAFKMRYRSPLTLTGWSEQALKLLMCDLLLLGEISPKGDVSQRFANQTRAVKSVRKLATEILKVTDGFPTKKTSVFFSMTKVLSLLLQLTTAATLITIVTSIFKLKNFFGL